MQALRAHGHFDTLIDVAFPEWSVYCSAYVTWDTYGTYSLPAGTHPDT